MYYISLLLLFKDCLSTNDDYSPTQVWLGPRPALVLITFDLATYKRKIQGKRETFLLYGCWGFA